jgi:hypothetical protein
VFSPCWARNSLLGPIPCWARPAGLLPACPLLPGLLLRRWRRSVAPCGCSTTTLLAPRDGGSWKAAGAGPLCRRRLSVCRDVVDSVPCLPRRAGSVGVHPERTGREGSAVAVVVAGSRTLQLAEQQAGVHGTVAYRSSQTRYRPA